MKKLLLIAVVMLSILFLISCGEEDEESIYGDITNDKSNEDPDDEIQDYQTRPDTNDTEINDNSNDEAVSDSDSDSDTEVDVTKDMILIPQGKAWLGCNENIETDCPENELPYTELSMKAYFIDKYEVTVAEFEKCVNAGGCGAQDDYYYTNDGHPYCNFGSSRTSHPMNCVSWFGANAYCVWAGKRLPSEGEWEKAARGGCEVHGEDDCEENSYVYTWGNEGAPDCAKVNMANDDINWGCGTDSTSVGGSYPGGDSPYGASDMLGNLYEWVSDNWTDDHTTAKPNGSSVGTPDSYGIIKGGGFIQDNPEYFRVSHRANQYPEEILDSRGFRCAADVE